MLLLLLLLLLCSFYVVVVVVVSKHAIVWIGVLFQENCCQLLQIQQQLVMN